MTTLRWTRNRRRLVPNCGRTLAKPLAERLPRQLELHARVVGDCVLWKGKPDKRGRLRRDDGREAFVYTLVWEQANGPLPDGRQINHHCDTPGCIKLEHLYAGTQRQNLDDARRRNRRRAA